MGRWRSNQDQGPKASWLIRTKRTHTLERDGKHYLLPIFSTLCWYNGESQMLEQNTHSSTAAQAGRQAGRQAGTLIKTDGFHHNLTWENCPLSLLHVSPSGSTTKSQKRKEYYTRLLPLGTRAPKPEVYHDLSPRLSSSSRQHPSIHLPTSALSSLQPGGSLLPALGLADSRFPLCLM